MKILIYCTFIFFLAINLQSYAQTETDSILAKVWTIEDFYENGKKLNEENMVEIVVDFQIQGTYYYWEENELTDGIWEYDESTAKIFFDKDTENKMIWNVISLEPEHLTVTFKEGGYSYKFNFKPKIKNSDN